MIEFKSDICDQCDAEHGYSAAIYEELNKRANEKYESADLSELPEDHYLWKEFELRMKPHQVNCAIFNGESAVCVMHLEDALIKLQDMNNASLRRKERKQISSSREE